MGSFDLWEELSTGSKLLLPGSELEPAPEPDGSEELPPLEEDVREPDPVPELLPGREEEPGSVLESPSVQAVTPARRRSARTRDRNLFKLTSFVSGDLKQGREPRRGERGRSVRTGLQLQLLPLQRLPAASGG